MLSISMLPIIVKGRKSFYTTKNTTFHLEKERTGYIHIDSDKNLTSSKAVFCYIMSLNNKTLLVVCHDFCTVNALQVPTTWKFDLKALQGVKKFILPRRSASKKFHQNRGQTVKRGCVVLVSNCNSGYCRIFGIKLRAVLLSIPSIVHQREKVQQHQTANSRCRGNF